MTAAPSQHTSNPGLSVEASAPSATRFALLGNPNTGRTTLFNRLCGLRAKTANFPGTTSDVRLGRCTVGHHRVQVADLPGAYGLGLDLPESQICTTYLEQGLGRDDAPDAAVVVADASNLARNLAFAGEVLARKLPVVLVLNMIDVARRRGKAVDAERLSREMGCPVVAICARTGQGVDDLVEAMAHPQVSEVSTGVRGPELTAWARGVANACTHEVEGDTRVDRVTDRLDAVATHPTLGLLVCVGVMTGLFITIFGLAQLPMNLIELLFTRLGQWLAALIPAGAIQDLVVDGLVAGLAGTVVFLPQICLLFFLISLLEDSGYLARAAFVADRILRRFGLPGQAFIPLLSAHACAVPAIMTARLIPDPRDRLATILVAPFMSCSARLPVYVLLIGFLLPHNALAAGLAFTGCYALGTATAVLTALLVRRTLVRGKARPMILELPPYRFPSVRTALLTTYDRAVVFLRNAGTIIFSICVILWWLSAYPVTDPPPAATALRDQAQALVASDPPAAAALEAEAETVAARHALAHSFVGRLGRAIEPVFRPLGYDWQLSVGILTSFAAREVFVSSMVIICGAGAESDDSGIIERIKTARRDDGTPMLTVSTAAGLLVFYVLAMQCLPTLAVTRREAGGWRWAGLQLGYMSAVAWLAALAVRQGLLLFGVA
ncbi:MAG: ferrous iron transporter B [Planctomycetota bacterium]|jgi:ferrous iron transport protein B